VVSAASCAEHSGVQSQEYHWPAPATFSSIEQSQKKSASRGSGSPQVRYPLGRGENRVPGKGATQIQQVNPPALFLGARRVRPFCGRARSGRVLQARSRRGGAAWVQFEVLARHRQRLATTKLRGVVIAGSVIVVDPWPRRRVGVGPTLAGTCLICADSGPNSASHRNDAKCQKRPSKQRATLRSARKGLSAEFRSEAERQS
jgi:hypothetical protein